MPGKVTHSEPSQERKWNRIKSGTGWRLTEEKEVRERKPNCLKRLEVTSHVTTCLFVFFFNVYKIYTYTHVKHVFYVHNAHRHKHLGIMHIHIKDNFFLTEKRCASLCKYACWSSASVHEGFPIKPSHKQWFPLEIHTFFNTLLHTIQDLSLQNHPLMQKSTEMQHTVTLKSTLCATDVKQKQQKSPSFPITKHAALNFSNQQLASTWKTWSSPSILNVETIICDVNFWI